MRTLNRTLGLYLFFLITFTSASVFAFKFEINSNGRMTLSQDDSGDHLIWISGCSFNEGSQGEIDAFFAMATWNDPAVARSVFRGEWVSCLTSEESGRWSRNHDDDIGNRLMSQILVSDHMDKKVVGQIRRTRNFSRNEATAFTIFVKPDLSEGETNTCDTAPRANLRSTLNHELGHALGFIHTQEKRWATMRANVLVGYYCDTDANHTLSHSFPDDLIGLHSEYGKSSLPQYRSVGRDLAALAYKNETDIFRPDSTISRADIGNFSTHFCPGDTVPELEFAVANRGSEKPPAREPVFFKGNETFILEIQIFRQSGIPGLW